MKLTRSTRRPRIAALLAAAMLALGLAVPAAQAVADPPAPTNLQATEVGWDQVVLSWEPGLADPHGSWFYEITNLTTGAIELAHASTTSVPVQFWPRLEPETTYTFEIRLVDDRGVRSEPSNQVTITTLAVPHVEPPANLEVTAAYSYTAYFAWEAGSSDPDITYRLISLSTGGGGTIYQGTTSTPANRPVNVQPGRTYSFEIVAIDENGVESEPSNRVTFTTPPVEPPSDVVADLDDDNKVTLTWSRPAGVDPAKLGHHLIYDGGILERFDVNAVDDDTLQVTIPRVTPGVTHEYTVRTRHPNGFLGNTSVPSDPVSVTAPPADDTTPPTGPTIIIEFDEDRGDIWRVTEPATDDTTPQSEIRYEALQRAPTGELYVADYDLDLPLEVVFSESSFQAPRAVRAVDEAGNRSAIVFPQNVG